MIKITVLFSGLFIFILILFFFSILLSNQEEPENETPEGVNGLNLSEEVLAYQPRVQFYCEAFGMKEYVNHLLAVMMVESGGKGEDVMQASESLGLPPNSLTAEESIQQGCKYFFELLQEAEKEGCDIDTVIQSYNYGPGFIRYVSKKGKKYAFELAEAFAKEKSGGKKVPYSHEIAKKSNGGWRYKYGNMFYVPLINQYFYVEQFEDETVQKIMNEALKYQGWKYVYGGSSPTTSFDCSGLTQWCFGQAGISLPRTAQEQYEFTQHLPLSEAKPGDLVFFQGTYDTANFITHVGIYVGENRMYDAGDPIGYTDLTSEYWKEHLVCAGRVKK